MNWEEINREIEKILNEKSNLELLIQNMSKFDIDQWIEPYNL